MSSAGRFEPLTATFESRLAEVLGVTGPAALHAWLKAAYEAEEGGRAQARAALDAVLGPSGRDGGEDPVLCREQLELALADSGTLLWELSGTAESERFQAQWRQMLWMAMAGANSEDAAPE